MAGDRCQKQHLIFARLFTARDLLFLARGRSKYRYWGTMEVLSFELKLVAPPNLEVTPEDWGLTDDDDSDTVVGIK